MENNKNYEKIEKEAKEALKKRPKMKVSGKSVFKLAEAMRKKK